MSIRTGSVIFLFGAGASVEAGLQTSTQIIDSIEKLVGENGDWQEYQRLYHCVKSGILYKYGINGEYLHNINVEHLVDTLTELTKRHEHTLSPFIGSWIPRLAEIDYKLIDKFKNNILDKLVDKWINLENPNNADYYKKLVQFQKECNFSLDLFSLNYDLCIEKSIDNSILELGFDNESGFWDYKRYKIDERVENKPIKLYKMHGSVDWLVESGKIKKIGGQIDAQKSAIIFGTMYKLRYIDPFLYFINEFRKKLLDDVQLLVTIGYSYSDEHVNAIITQSFNHNEELKILNVSHNGESVKICEMLGLGNEKQKLIITEKCSAKEFLDEKISLEYIENKIGKDSPF